MKNLDIKFFEYQCENGLRVALVHKPDFSRSFFLCGVNVGESIAGNGLAVKRFFIRLVVRIF